jgi:hypothetical protein
MRYRKPRPVTAPTACVVVFMAASLTSACAMSPRDGQVVASRSTPVPYEIVVPWSLSSVIVKAVRYDSNGNFAYWDDEWTCGLPHPDCEEQPYLTDGQGSEHWVIRRSEAIPTTVTGGTRHWIRTGLPSPKWKTKVKITAGQLRSLDQYNVAAFANDSDTSWCMVNNFLEESAASAYVNCDNDTYEMTIYATGD